MTNGIVNPIGCCVVTEGVTAFADFAPVPFGHLTVEQLIASEDPTFVGDVWKETDFAGDAEDRGEGSRLHVCCQIADWTAV